MSERRQLADIEKHLSAEDPRLTRLIAEWSVEPTERHAHRLRAVAVCAWACTATLFVGIVIGGAVGITLFAVGGLGLVGSLAVGSWTRWKAGRPPRRPADPDVGYGRGRPSWPGPDYRPSWWWWV